MGTAISSAATTRTASTLLPTDNIPLGIGTGPAKIAASELTLAVGGGAIPTFPTVGPAIDTRFDTLTGFADGAAITAVPNGGSGGTIMVNGSPKYKGGVDGRGCVTFPTQNDYLSFTGVVGGTGGATWTDPMTPCDGLDAWVLMRASTTELDLAGTAAAIVYNPSGPIFAAGVGYYSGGTAGIRGGATLATTANVASAAWSSRIDGGLVLLRVSLPRVAANTTQARFYGTGLGFSVVSFTGTPTISRVGGIGGTTIAFTSNIPATTQILRVVIFGRWLPDDEAAKVHARILYDAQVESSLLLPLGNSLIAQGASGATTEAGGWPLTIQTALQSAFTGLAVRPLALSGRGTRTILSTYTATIRPSILRSPGRTVVPIWEGTNDLSNAEITPRQAADDLLRLCDLVYADGGLPVLLTVLKRTSGTVIDPAVWEAERLLVNAYLRVGAVDRPWLGFYDIASDPAFVLFPAGTLGAGDGIHLSDAGRTAVALGIRAAVSSALGGRIGREGTTREALSASTDNWARWPSRRCLLDVTGAINLTGRVAAEDAWTEEYVNVGTGTLTVKHDVTSTAANRFLCAADTDVTVAPRGSFRIQYDLTAARWRVF